MLSEIIAIASFGLDIYNTVCGVSTSKDLEADISRRVDGLEASVSRLAEGIYYAPSLQSVTDTSRPVQQRITDCQQIRQALDPLHQTLGCDILSSDVITVPEKTQLALARNAWDVLDHIQPLGIAKAPDDPNAVPIAFNYGGAQFVGWQKRGVLPMLLDISYTSHNAFRGYPRNPSVSSTLLPSFPESRAIMIESKKKGLHSTFVFNGHYIEFRANYWNSLETVLYDGQEVSKKRFFGLKTTHSFRVTENGQQTPYVISTKLSVWTGQMTDWKILRNGVLIYES